MFRGAADRQHTFMAGQVKDYPAAHCFSLMAMAELLYPHKELIRVGTGLPQELFVYHREQPANDLSILFPSEENKKEMWEIAPFTASYPMSENVEWYPCENGVCRTPQSDFDKLNSYCEEHL